MKTYSLPIVLMLIVVAISCACAQDDAPPPPPTQMQAPVVLAQAGNAGNPAQTYSQAEMDAATRAANEANSRANMAQDQTSSLQKQLADLQRQHRQELAKAKVAGSRSPKYRRGMQRASLLAVKISSLQARINRGETGGPASKWARPAVGQSLASGNVAGMVGDKPNTTLNSRFWRKKVDNQQLAVAMARLRDHTKNTAREEAAAAVTTHNEDTEAHKPIQEAIVGESTAREDGDNAIWKWIKILAGGVILGLIVGFIGWVLPKSRREVAERETVVEDRPLPRHEHETPSTRLYEEPARPFALTDDEPPAWTPPATPLQQEEFDEEDDIDLPEFLRRRDGGDQPVRTEPAEPVAQEDISSPLPTEPAPQPESPATGTDTPRYERPAPRPTHRSHRPRHGRR